MRIYVNADQAYLKTLEMLLHTPDCRSQPRGKPVSELLDDTTRIMVPKAGSLRTNCQHRNDVMAKYHEKELAAYLHGGFAVDDWTKLSKFWTDLANPDGTINSNYGALIFRNWSCGDKKFEKTVGPQTPWEWARESLITGKDTRQAFVRVSLPRHQWIGNKDQVCTMHLNFLIRDRTLRLTTVMRSQDVVKGWAYDVPFFIYLQHRMLDELRETYPWLGVGTYTHFVHSLHLYEKDRTVAERMLYGLT
jgi:thymidylate synthase